MGLFSSSDLKKAEIPAKGSFRKSPGKSKVILANTADQLKQLIAELEPETNYHFSTGGAWSLHDMIAMTCQKIGPSRLFLSTWTITEEPMRVLFQLIREGWITELNCLFDYRIEKRKADAFQLAKVNASKVKLSKSHAKVAVLISNDWGVSIVGSANLSKNPRIEAGVLSTCISDSEFHSGWITNEITHGNTFRKHT
ncbi:MAG: hypothetical protein ACK4SF_04475 [Algoriphagus aquaeductus]|uniref:hypothetical protein n=1 Tax=Algoriphagus aquaeductus TaxID=475299 RepID=UPI00391AC759